MFHKNSDKSSVLLKVFFKLKFINLIFLQKNIPFDNIYYFDDVKYRNILLEHNGKSDVLDYDCYKYTYADENTRVNETFFTNLEGSFNLTTIVNNPIIITAPYFAKSYHYFKFGLPSFIQ